jgi:hypothetical protein
MCLAYLFTLLAPFSFTTFLARVQPLKYFCYRSVVSLMRVSDGKGMKIFRPRRFASRFSPFLLSTNINIRRPENLSIFLRFHQHTDTILLFILTEIFSSTAENFVLAQKSEKA